MKKQKKTRQYKKQFIEYGFIESQHSPTIPMCLICKTTLSNESMRPSKLKNHLFTVHKEESEKPVIYFESLKKNFDSRITIKNIFTKNETINENRLITSFEVSKLIAKTGNPHTIGESLILPAMSIILNNCTGLDSKNIIDSIPLSNSSVSRRIDEMANDVERELLHQLRNVKFALQLDETTLPDNSAILMAYVRYLHENTLKEEMLFIRNLKSDSRGETIFQELKNYFYENRLPLENILSCATDGAASMTGRYKGFIAYLKAHVPSVFCVHCVIHRQHLVLKKLSENLHRSLVIVIKAINYIKSSSLQDRIFRQLCETNNEGFVRLLLHTEVRWLSKGNCLSRVVTLWNTLISFFEGKEMKSALLLIKHDVFYLCDIFEKLNLLTKQLQSKNSNLILCKEVISGFIRKIEIYVNNIRNRDFTQFQALKTIANDLKGEEIDVFIEHLENLRGDMIQRFNDLINLDIPSWIIDPFSINVEIVEVLLQESLIDLQNDLAAKMCFSSEKYNFWFRNNMTVKYNLLWENAKLFLIAFPSSYLVETGFSRVNEFITKRNRLDIVNRGDIRLNLSKIEPNIKNLISKYQSQGSH